MGAETQETPGRLEELADEQLIQRSRRAPEVEHRHCLDILYERYYPRVAYWCLRIAGSRLEAEELAQEVFLRVHSRLGSFRGESRFSTWLYAVTRSVAINRGISARRRQTASLDHEKRPEPPDPAPGADESAERQQVAERVRQALREDLEPLEAKVLYLHFVDGLTLAAITELLNLDNKSGAKAFVVNGMRKLRRRFGIAPVGSRRDET